MEVGYPFVALGLGHFLGPYLRLTICLNLERPERAQGQLWATELQRSAGELDPGNTDELSDPSWWKHFPELGLCGCLSLASLGLEDRQGLNYHGMGELPESPAGIVMHCASQPGERLPSSQMQKDMESLSFWRQRNERMWLHRGYFFHDKIFTRQSRTAPLQRQGASLWATQFDGNTTPHIQPTCSPAFRSILVLLYTAHWLRK